jgi:hypothetical protein
MCTRVSMPFTLGFTSGRSPQGFITSVTLSTSLLPMRPAGWFIAYWFCVNPSTQRSVQVDPFESKLQKPRRSNTFQAVQGLSHHQTRRRLQAQGEARSALINVASCLWPITCLELHEVHGARVSEEHLQRRVRHRRRGPRAPRVARPVVERRQLAKA